MMDVRRASGRTFERWVISAGTRGTELRLTQKRSAWLNVAFGLALVAGGAWLRARPDSAGFGIALLLFGVLWVAASIAAVRERRVVYISGDAITLERRPGRIADEWDRSRVATIVLTRKRKKKRSDPVPFPWRVSIEDDAGVRFRGRFRFQSEDTARKLARELATLLSTSVEDRTSGPGR